MTRTRRTLGADAILVAICAVWGTSFPLVRMSVAEMNPAAFLAFRFWIGLALLTPLALRSKPAPRPGRAGQWLALGAVMFAGMFLQTAGLKYTTASNSGFLTAVSFILVPVWAVAFGRRRPGLWTWAGIATAAVGVVLLSGPAGAHGFNRGDAFTLAAAAAFSLQIIFIDMFVRPGESFRAAWAMLFWTAALSTAAVPLTGPVGWGAPATVWLSGVYLGVFATALAFWAQTHFQPMTSAPAAAVLYTTEPLFAAAFAWAFLGERLSPGGWAGAAFILGGILLHETASARRDLPKAGTPGPEPPSVPSVSDRNKKEGNFSVENEERAVNRESRPEREGAVAGDGPERRERRDRGDRGGRGDRGDRGGRRDRGDRGDRGPRREPEPMDEKVREAVESAVDHFRESIEPFDIAGLNAFQRRQVHRHFEKTEEYRVRAMKADGDDSALRVFPVGHLRRMAETLVQEVLVTGTPRALPPMGSFERFVVHEAMKTRNGIRTESAGGETDRHVVIHPVFGRVNRKAKRRLTR